MPCGIGAVAITPVPLLGIRCGTMEPTEKRRLGTGKVGCGGVRGDSASQRDIVYRGAVQLKYF